MTSSFTGGEISVVSVCGSRSFNICNTTCCKLLYGQICYITGLSDLSLIHNGREVSRHGENTVPDGATVTVVPKVVSGFSNRKRSKHFSLYAKDYNRKFFKLMFKNVESGAKCRLNYKGVVIESTAGQILDIINSGQDVGLLRRLDAVYGGK